MANLTFIDPYASIQNPCEDIRNGQFVCKDCATLAFCVQQDGMWNSLEITRCETNKGLYCDEEFHGCVHKSACSTIRGPKFECQNSGEFPDPFDCKQYHTCNEAKVDERGICPQGTAYSPATKSCSLSSYDDICYKAQYKCENPGDMGPWPSDPNIYYVCWYSTADGKPELYPLLHRCANGYEFKADRCIQTYSSVNNPSTSTTASSAAPSAAPSTAAPAATTPLISCGIGSTLKANPNDCHSYYVCSDGKLTSKTCPGGTYFQVPTLSCVFGSC